MDPAERTKFTEDLLASLPPSVLPPLGFNPLTATNAELMKYGLPARPDKTALPKHSAVWERIMSRPLHVVAPKYQLNKTVHRPKSAADTNASNATWSGAVLSSPPSGQTFYSISASFIVPNAYPPPSARVSATTWQDGSYDCSIWIGIDGYGTAGVLQTGVTCQVTVSGGQITSQSAAPWFEWYPAYEVGFSNFSVKPGDLVHCVVCGGTGSTSGYCAISNLSSGISTSTTIPSPQNGIVIQGVTAEWIAEDPTEEPSGTPWPFPDYGATFFYDTLCASRGAAGVTENDLSSATLLNIVQGGSTMSTVVQETPGSLLLYAFTNS
jgi:hypothetical protein